MIGRVPMSSIRSLDGVADFVAASDGAKVLIFDADNTLAPQGAPVEEFGALVNRAIDRFEASPGVDRVIVITNGPQRDVPNMISRGNKPWTSRRRLGLRGVGSPIVVIGDQVLTDGLLAWRLGATFLHLVLEEEKEEPRQLAMRRMGRLVLRLFLRTPDDAPGPG